MQVINYKTLSDKVNNTNIGNKVENLWTYSKEKPLQCSQTQRRNSFI